MTIAESMRYRDLVKQIEAAGWVLFRTKGSHFHYRHPTLPGIVTIPCGGKLNHDAPPGTLNSILKQARLK
jgi:predicted RNA binding protein YcfA (HicA-like mRNA interferase family)